MSNPVANNPFCLLGRTATEPGPLCPWEHSDHANGYVAVDRTQEAYNDFCGHLPKANLARAGLTVLVYGEAGCGKTSLIHRCALFVENSQLSSHKITSKIVDRSIENVAELTIPRRCEDTVGAVMQVVGDDPSFLATTAFTSIPILPDGADQLALRKTVEGLSRQLSAAKRNLILIAPKLELPDELRMYLTVLQRPGVCLFMETDNPEVARAAERWNNEGKRSLLALEVGALSLEDGWKFVSARLQKEKQRAASPDFTEAGVTEYMQNRSGHTKISVRELERVCIALYEEARAAASQNIGYQQFADHYLRVGLIGRKG